METQNQLQKTNETSMLVKFKNLLNSDAIRNKFQETLGKKSPMFMSNLTTIMSGSSELQKCEHMSVISSALMAASMDLPLTPGLGFAGIVPYWDSQSGTMKAQFQIMKKGFIQLAQRTGLFKIINVSEVYEGELKSYNKFTGEYVFDETCKKSNLVIGYVSYFRLINGFEKYFYMPIDKLDVHARRYSKSFQRGKGKWADKEQGGYEQMCEKTVLKLNLSTYAPLSVDINMMNAIVYDQTEIRDVEGKEFNYIDNEASHMLEEKEVVEINNGNTLTLNKSDEAKSKSISKSVVEAIDKGNEKVKETIAEPVVEDVPEEQEGKVYTEDELKEMGVKVSDLAKKILPQARLKILESLKIRKTKNFWSDAILAYQSGKIDEFTDSYMKGGIDAREETKVTETSELVPEKKEEPADKKDLPWEKGIERTASSDLKPNKNFENETSVVEGGKIEISEVDPDTKKRAIMDVYNIYQALQAKDVNDEKIKELHGKTYANMEDFSERAPKSDIEFLIK